MKTVKTLTILTLAASLTLAPMSLAWAYDGRHGRHGHYRGSRHYYGGHHHRYYPRNVYRSTTIINEHDHGGEWVALAGGTMLGLVVGSLANQPPPPPAQPQVVVVGAERQRQMELEIELERAKARTLELLVELERLE